MRLKQTVLAVGILISLSAAETTAPTIKSDTTDSASSLVTAAADGKFIPIGLRFMAWTKESKICKYPQEYEYETECRRCDVGEFKPCSVRNEKNMIVLHVRNESCEVVTIAFNREKRAPGCRAVCLMKISRWDCCHGYYQRYRYTCTTECPGGGKNPCNGHGKCDTRGGHCDCDAGFEGISCALCENKTKYGPNCSEDCVCPHGNCNSGVYGDGLCATGNPCNNSISPCGTNSQCVHTGPGTHQCVCDQGYTKSGTQCVLENPCQSNNGGCFPSQDCIYMGPAQRKCQCKDGYETINRKGHFCSIKEMCTPGLCGPIATCVTVDPYKHTCVCPGRSSWNGVACSNNIGEMFIPRITADPRFTRNFTYMHKMISRVYSTLLARYGPFTIFAPTDSAFRNVLSETEFETLLSDDNRIKRLLRQHIIADKHSKDDDEYELYNLQGNPVTIQTVNENDTMKYYYIVKYDSGYSEKALIKKSTMELSNGLMYEANFVMGLRDQVEDYKGTVMDLIANQSEYSKMYTMIMAANLSETFSQPNTTVLIPNNTAWGKLSLNEQHYLTSDEEGLRKLTVILKNHVFPGVIDITDLIISQNKRKSFANVDVKVEISSQGQVQVDDVGITKANIPISTGVCHRVGSVIVMNSLLRIINDTCLVSVTEDVEGACVRCGKPSHCILPTDIPTSRMKFCESEDTFYNWVTNSDFIDRYAPYRHRPERRYFTLYGCAQICLRNNTNIGCCPGFYGPACISCPGAYGNPCNGNGKCSDGRSGTGLCSCNTNFAGTSCNQCAQNDSFGPLCDKTCTCQFGLCDAGPRGAGTCKPDTCQLGYIGENCDKKLVPCESDDVCLLNSKCFLQEDGIGSCYCAPGHEKDGEQCFKIEYCADGRNPCDQQATCSEEEPGVINCTCNRGWHGDGFHCMPNHPCNDSIRCHRAAICHDLEPGQYVCVCKTGYRGNGLVCDLVDLCLENNGGCHPEAKCTFIRAGERTCTCPALMAGDGITCRGTISKEVMNHPMLINFRYLMKGVNPSNLLLDSVNSIYTFFAPSDDALRSFLESDIARVKAGYWQKEENVLSFLNFHTIYGAFSTDDMMAFDGVIKSYATLFDGFSLRIVNTNNSLHIFANQSKFAVIEEANIPAFNGYFHIIDTVLEPFLPDKAPSLSEFLSSKPEYRMFYEALQKTQLLDVVSSLQGYTLFVLGNNVFKEIRRKPTADFLKYYIVPQLIFTPCITDGDEVDTLLGSQHRLRLNYRHAVTINENGLIHSDMLTAGGVVHELQNVLHPVLNRCDLNSSTADLGPCGDCLAGNLSCPDGFTSLGASHVIKYKCHFQKFKNADWQNVDCQQICVNYTSMSECCAGFYGYHCDECPGGAENPCSGNGVCDDGEKGSGICKCHLGFSGTVCDRCESTDLVPPYCNISYNSCGYMNGNCSQHARCNDTSGEITCQCFLGYQGDGYTCTSWCDSLEHWKCHPNAICAPNVSHQTFKCECNPGFHGNGTWCQPNSDPCSSNNGGCDLERATCHFTQPKVTDMDEGKPVCECKSGYVGDGKLCSTDLLDAVSRIPSLSLFHSWLLAGKKNNSNIIELLCDRRKTYTVFVSVSKLISNTSFAVVNGIFKLPNYPATDRVSSDIIQGNVKINDIRQWTLKSLNGQEIRVTLNDQRMYLANGVRIIQGNIEAQNGIIHLTAAPLASSEDVHSLKSTGEAAFLRNHVIVGVVAAIIVTLMAVVVIVIYKKGIRLFRYQPTNPHGNVTFSKIKESDYTVSLPDNTQYTNPLVSSQNL
ncbi:hypothetical protein BsWGS_13710 [Bradybaena similaris]